MALYTINNTTLTFNSIFFVDSSKSSSGDGTELSPYNTLDTAVSASKSGDAIVLKGLYTIGQGYVFKSGVTFIGYGAATVLRGSQVTGNSVSIYRLVIDALGYGETFSIGGSGLNLYNVAYVNSASGDGTREIFAGYVGTFRNCLFQGTQNTISTSTFTPSGSYNNALSCGSLAFGSNVTTSLSNVTYDNVYRITSSGSVNTGTGNDVDGSVADIGVYGGAFAWSLVYLDTQPATGGSLKNRLSDMNLGDYIRCQYKATSGAAGNFYALGETFPSNEIYLNGTGTPDGHFYLIKVDNGKFLADREVQTAISFSALNAAGYAKGAKFNDSMIPPLTSNTGYNGVASASSNFNASFPAWKAFDRKAGTDDVWASASGQTTGWLAYEFNSPVLVQRYTLRARNSDLTSAPRRWALEAWDGANWVILHSAEYTNWVTDEERTYSFYNTFKYAKYRINVLQNNGQVYIVIAELRLCQEMDESFVRLPTGARGYMSVDGYLSATDVGRGVYPTNNEWDNYLTRSPFSTSATNRGDLVWHYQASATGCWAQETDVSNPMLITVRGKLGTPVRRDPNTYTNTASYRPIIELIQT